MKVKRAVLIGVAVLAGCEPAENVEVLPLPPIVRPSAEARLGIPEVSGEWYFAGWEIIRGDTTALERTFPSFGSLRIGAQRLDSIAGTFALAGGPVPVVGEVRRDGHISFVTFDGRTPAGFVAGEIVRDTLWLELTSILVADEWPRDARAAFVRDEPDAVIAWLRGARPGDLPPAVPRDSLNAMTGTATATTDASRPPASSGDRLDVATPVPVPEQTIRRAPAPSPAPSTAADLPTVREEVTDSVPTPTPVQPPPEPEAVEPEPRRDGPVLLGEPIRRPNR